MVGEVPFAGSSMRVWGLVIRNQIEEMIQWGAVAGF